MQNLECALHNKYLFSKIKIYNRYFEYIKFMINNLYYNIILFSIIDNISKKILKFNHENKKYENRKNIFELK